MKRYITFLRAINVGGHNVIRMQQLKLLFEAIGFKNVETFIASGNVIFDSKSLDNSALENKIEKHLFSSLGNNIAAFIRTTDQLEDIINHKPFPEEKYSEAAANNIGFIKRPLDKESVNKLNSLKTDIDDFHSYKTEIYWLCKKKQSQSTFSGNIFEKRLNSLVTFRGINTLEKILLLSQDHQNTRM
ncbi:MAG TPA: DUF1697 domain-containing protein [Ignavibacteriaceae bacterium]